MSGRFEFSRPARRGQASGPWFRIGSVDFGSVGVFCLLVALSVVVYTVEPLDKPIGTGLALWPEKISSGQMWRLATWPFALVPGTRLFSVVIAVVVLWFSGSRLEELTGRVRMAWLLAAIVIIPGIATWMLDYVAFGPRSVQFAILLLFIAEYPHIRFFFGIKAWILGVAFVAIDVLQMVADRSGAQLVLYLFTLAVAAIAARTVGLLGDYPWIPAVPLPGQRRTKKQKRAKGAKVVEGPWGGAPSGGLSPTEHAELDDLLDKTSAGGLDSLSKAEKARLNELSKKLRG